MKIFTPAFVLFLFIYLGSASLFIKKVEAEDIKNIAGNITQVKNLDEQARAIVARPDTADTADIQAIKDKVVLGSSKASLWQPDAKFFSYRRVFSLPDNVSKSDQITAQADSYYFESKNTRDVSEILFDRNSNNILRIDTNPNQLRNYANNFSDILTIKVGPKKALEIAMLSPDFQSYKQSHDQILTYVVLNAVQNVPIGSNVTQYWFVGMGRSFSDQNGVQALVNIQTGELVSKEAINIINQINSRGQ